MALRETSPGNQLKIAARSGEPVVLMSVHEPEQLICPVTHIMYRDPVVISSGNTYERSAIVEYWRLQGKLRDPLTNTLCSTAVIFPNMDKRRDVQAFLDQHPDHIPEGWCSREVQGLPPQEVASKFMFREGNLSYFVRAACLVIFGYVLGVQTALGEVRTSLTVEILDSSAELPAGSPGVTSLDDPVWTPQNTSRTPHKSKLGAWWSAAQYTLYTFLYDVGGSIVLSLLTWHLQRLYNIDHDTALTVNFLLGMCFFLFDRCHLTYKAAGVVAAGYTWQARHTAWIVAIVALVMLAFSALAFTFAFVMFVLWLCGLQRRLDVEVCMVMLPLSVALQTIACRIVL